MPLPCGPNPPSIESLVQPTARRGAHAARARRLQHSETKSPDALHVFAPAPLAAACACAGAPSRPRRACTTLRGCRKRLRGGGVRLPRRCCTCRNAAARTCARAPLLVRVGALLPPRRCSRAAALAPPPRLHRRLFRTRFDDHLPLPHAPARGRRPRAGKASVLFSPIAGKSCMLSNCCARPFARIRVPGRSGACPRRAACSPSGSARPAPGLRPACAARHPHTR